MFVYLLKPLNVTIKPLSVTIKIDPLIGRFAQTKKEEQSTLSKNKQIN